MNCERARELVALAASGDVIAEERGALDSHLAQCVECRAEAEEFEALCGQLAAMREESAPENAYVTVRARVASEIKGRSWPRWIAAFAGAVACSLILVIGLRDKQNQVGQTSRLPIAQMQHTTANVREEPPVTAMPVAHRQLKKAIPRATTTESTEPLVVHMFTNDPDVVIYWIADAKRSRSKKEITQ